MNDAASRLPASRKAEVAAFVNRLGQVTVSALAERFGVSADTIRRDLDQLDSDGQLIRTHGGAMSTSAVPWHDTSLDDRSRLQAAQKDVIGRLTSDLVVDGNVLFINGGTTTLALVPHITERRELIIATNNLSLPPLLNDEICRDLYVIGGHVRISGLVTVGPVSFFSPISDAENEIHVDLAIIGVGAVDTEGVSTSNLDEAAMLSQMARRAQRVAILADTTKHNRRLFASVCDWSHVNYLVTNDRPSGELAEALSDAGVEVLAPTQQN
ncbi:MULTISPECIES: DeoR/GlpR family DNA-binding transcription regulator [unclassified Actinomyces]|uniref:DeoR/GlpR family DNA-binding transcription regulator n=1 Tax=unclassified Actinomyces TaxID=2609248 RepID=UPI0020176C81|nr:MULTISPECIES: DeoR/GlpR family DNA-binding transcription regulator [unclassified Actinomyces]MCL3778132.1 DeoR/GlpR transcriptional regulator [Actinomyces sp. AC-20-1]MCL3789409.1 DeoR/GlpR transcriptional regulator [Actinomyces sp. 187325]MCL3791734.1 DeoR/GlpR transcriptional regulator [Actinomyces sp. 186855]MCL3794386.1 DeoR/GlpR transcriptional regulator [Actinomyces sp. 217892]